MISGEQDCARVGILHLSFFTLHLLLLIFIAHFQTANTTNTHRIDRRFLLQMARTKFNPSQLSIDFLAGFRQMLVSLGSPDKLLYNESVFTKLTDQWEAKRTIPADLLFHKSPVDAVAYQLKKSDDRLVFPAELIGGEIRGVQNLTGFAALFRGQGWVILPTELSGIDKNLNLNILTAAIGLSKLYSVRKELFDEAERVALAALLPEAEIRNFFGLRLSKYPDGFRSEVSNYFNLPFAYILKRAQQLGVVSDTVADDARQVRQPLRPAQTRRAGSSQAA